MRLAYLCKKCNTLWWIDVDIDPSNIHKGVVCPKCKEVAERLDVNNQFVKENSAGDVVTLH